MRRSQETSSPSRPRRSISSQNSGAARDHGDGRRPVKIGAVRSGRRASPVRDPLCAVDRASRGRARIGQPPSGAEPLLCTRTRSTIFVGAISLSVSVPFIMVPQPHRGRSHGDRNRHSSCSRRSQNPHGHLDGIRIPGRRWVTSVRTPKASPRSYRCVFSRDDKSDDTLCEHHGQVR